jgi:serine/threonine-protein kinase HipA
MSIRAIEVRIWNMTVGAVAADPELGAYVFEYEPRWLRRGIELAPLLMPTGGTQSSFIFPALPESFKGLPGLVADALPDDFGNALIDAWMSNHDVAKDSVTALDRLAYMGRRGLGALEFRPMRGSAIESQKPLEMKSLVEAAREVLHGDLAGDAHAQAALANIIRVGTSAGGARAKAVLAWNPRTHEIRSGQFEVAEGFEHWLLKFDGIGRDRELGTSADYGRIEYAYHLMATQGAGIEMSACRLLEENGRAHFMTRRFDREGNAKHHVQSLCALLHLDYKQRATHAYEQYFQTIAQLGLNEAAFAQAFRRVAFNVMARNCDDHTKNFAFRLKQGARWELAPAYDLTHAYNPRGEWTYQHLLSVNGRFDEIRSSDLLELGARFDIPQPKLILDEVRAAIARWSEFARAAGVPAERRRHIAADFRPV